MVLLLVYSLVMRLDPAPFELSLLQGVAFSSFTQHLEAKGAAYRLWRTGTCKALGKVCTFKCNKIKGVAKVREHKGI